MKTRTSLMLCVLAFIALAWATSAQAAMTAYWNFDEGAGATAADSSGNGNTGTLIAGGGGAASWVTGCTGLAADKALQFKGWTGRLSVPIVGPANLGITNAFTMELWAKYDYFSNYEFLLEGTTSNGGATRQWFWQSGTSIGGATYWWSDANAAWQKTLTNTTFADYNWHQYAFRYNGSTLYTYKDGVPKDTFVISGSPNLPTFTYLLIGGKNQAWSEFEGVIDEPGIWNEDLGLGKTESMYNITKVNGGALKDYDPDEMKTLYGVYDTGTPASITSNAGTLPWKKFTGGSGTAGSVTYDGTDYRAYFDGTSGVMTPEPATLALLGLGGLGLILGRKRR